jgi:hypothetical protein
MGEGAPSGGSGTVPTREKAWLLHPFDQRGELDQGMLRTSFDVIVQVLRPLSPLAWSS